ncbi:Di-/tripeptide transporter [Sphingobacterium spiritivorum]|uniref:Di-/tripeptide transporter n=1 Tax=Sphingobacterium spiritivorum TaxID=258 RepID=A0A380CX05_SPHSI|nr:MFS transporter [Sphingobacterium spiritivorum]SUJ29986.1 Di-/tripeptide transporter [Sphingobacterium spiritivorum]
MNDQNRAVSGTLEKDGIDGSTVLGHPSGLLVLFFTEMWERFSYYGMRVLLIQFLTSAVIFGSPFSGWGWTAEQAGALYGTYAMLVYLTPILGGIIADKYIGSRKAVIIGAAVMTIGHAAMAFDNSYMFFAGLACLIIGTGFFKPNMPSILGEMYKHLPEKKDGAYTIFLHGSKCRSIFWYDAMWLLSRKSRLALGIWTGRYLYVSRHYPVLGCKTSDG